MCVSSDGLISPSEVIINYVINGKCFKTKFKASILDWTSW